ncbi:hypothetical protein LXL04_018182 [Taraxacum kok-saghyz]
MSKRMARSSDEEEEVTIAEFMGKIRNIKGVKRDRQDDMNQVSMKRKREFVFKKKNVSRKELMRIRTRVSPKSFIDVIKGLNKKQKEAVEEIGFGSFIGMKLKHIPTRLGFFVVDNYDKEANCIRLGHEYLEITKDKISDAFGLPANGVEMEYLEECNKDNELLKRWNDMFDGHIEENLLNKLVENVDKIQEIDWCQFVQDCLKVSRDNWDPKAPNDTYNGPLTLLVLIYADGVKCSKHLKRRRLPLIQSWSNFDIETRERIEIAEGKFGSEGLRDDDIEDDVYVNERGSKECDTEQSLEREEDWQITVCKSNVSPVKKKIIVELQRTYNEVVKAKNKFQSTVCKALKKFPDCDIVKEFDRKVKSLYKGEVEDEDGIGIDNTSEEHEEYNDENNVSHSELQEEVDGEDVKQVQNTNKEGEDDIEVHTNLQKALTHHYYVLRTAENKQTIESYIGKKGKSYLHPIIKTLFQYEMDDDMMFTIASDSSSAASEEIIYSNQAKKNKENDVSEVYSSSRNEESNHHTEENDSDEVYFSSASESSSHSPHDIYSTPIQKQDETNVHDLYVDDTKTSIIDGRRKSNSEWEIKFKKICAEEDLTNSGNEDGVDKSKEQQPSDNTKETTKSSTGSEVKKCEKQKEKYKDVDEGIPSFSLGLTQSPISEPHTQFEITDTQINELFDQQDEIKEKCETRKEENNLSQDDFFEYITYSQLERLEEEALAKKNVEKCKEEGLHVCIKPTIFEEHQKGSLTEEKKKTIFREDEKHNLPQEKNRKEVTQFYQQEQYSEKTKEQNVQQKKHMVNEANVKKTSTLQKKQASISSSMFTFLPKNSKFKRSYFNKRRKDEAIHFFTDQAKGVSNSHDTKAVREYFEGFYQQQYVFGGAINAWALVLNHEEQRKSKDSPSRFFFPIFQMTDNLLKKCKSKNFDVFEQVFDQFYSFIVNSLNHKKDLIDLKPFDMVFFPMHDENANHYYVIVFNLLKGEGVVLDNIKKTRSKNVGYGGVTFHIKRLFYDYLMTNDNEKAPIFKDIDLRQEQMKWGTTKNIYDCGIFAMRHMETYKGEEEGKWSCGLSPEGPRQYRLIQILRAKYMFKILNSDINLRREKVIEEAKFFATIPTNQQEMLLKRAELDIADRFG